jgi:mycofactocin precursor
MGAAEQEKRAFASPKASHLPHEREATARTPMVATGGEAPDCEADNPVLEELLVEDVSIDGMCGVY